VGEEGNKRFCLVLVKPSHYDDDGYVVRWLRSPIPSTSLAALYGLAPNVACSGLRLRSTSMHLMRPIRAYAAIVSPR
jgi:hypothetical protein